MTGWMWSIDIWQAITVFWFHSWRSLHSRCAFRWDFVNYCCYYYYYYL